MKFYSNLLKQSFTLSLNGDAKFSDGTIYEKSEIKVLKGEQPEVVQIIHRIKKKFDGIVIDKESIRDIVILRSS